MSTATNVTLALESVRILLEFIELAQGLSEEETQEKWKETQKRIQDANAAWERAG